MMRLYVLVEGQTEEQFVKAVLAPHLQGRGILVLAIVVETSRDASGRKRRGGGHWKHWHRDLQRLTAEHSGADVRFTTLFDLYGLPDDFPDLDEQINDSNTVHRADNLTAAMARVVNDHRVLPYLQRHEFEALVLTGLDVLERLLDAPGDLNGLAALRAQLGGAAPEDINDGKDSAPSKRLRQLIPSYRKTVHGPLVVEGIGLETMRGACPRFDAWVTKLEALGEIKP